MALNRRQQARQWVREACEANGCPSLGLAIRIEWSKRMVRAAGVSYPDRRLIRLSVPQWERNDDVFNENTVKHEACHVIAGHAAGHGPRWRDTMQRAGLEPQQYHTAGIATDIKVRCGCRVFTITKQRERKMQQGSNYLCRLCKQRLKLI